MQIELWLAGSVVLLLGVLPLVMFLLCMALGYFGTTEQWLGVMWLIETLWLGTTIASEIHQEASLVSPNVKSTAEREVNRLLDCPIIRGKVVGD